MERILVVGPSGSGKSTLADRLSARLGLPRTEMDALWWESGWTEAGPERLRARLTAAVEVGDRWIIDGNYFTVGARDVVWPRADTVVFLDFPRWRTILRILRRSAARTVGRVELWSGNRERPLRILHRDELLRFAWREHAKYRQRYEAIRDDPELAQLTWVTLRTPSSVRTWLASVGAG